MEMYRSRSFWKVAKAASLEVKQAKHDRHDQGQGAFFQAPNLLMVSLMFVLGKDYGTAKVPGSEVMFQSENKSSSVLRRYYEAVQSRLDFGLTKSKGFKTLHDITVTFPVMSHHQVSRWSHENLAKDVSCTRQIQKLRTITDAGCSEMIHVVQVRYVPSRHPLQCLSGKLQPLECPKKKW